MAYDEARGDMVLFPGYGDEGSHGGTWVRRDGEWLRVHPGQEPESRFGGMMAYDPVREVVVLFGGYGANPEGGQALALNDTWTWDGQRWHREDPPTSPSERAFAAMAHDGRDIVLFGGVGIDDQGTPYSRLGDTWTWDGTTWTRREPGVSPPDRNSAGMVFDATRGEAVLFGGSGAGTPNECTVFQMNICIDLDGEGGDSGELADTWVWDGETWSPRTPASAPQARSSMGMAYDPVRERTVLFSGVDVGGLFWDTWTWDGTDWTEVTPGHQPGPRFSPSMAFDPAAGQAVLYGGHRITYHASDIWGWDGAAWTSLEEPTPPERIDAVMAPDPATGLPLLFGGLGDEYYGDTWLYDDGWQRLDPPAAPSPRFNAAAALDTQRDEVVLFGGRVPGDDVGDTWVWDGQTWEDRTPSLPALSPLPRRSSAMAYDEARGEAVLFGGWNSDLDLRLADTWTWDGSGWSLELVTGGPPALRDHMMVPRRRSG